MIKIPPVVANSLLGAATLALIGTLIYLYDKTQAVDLGERNEIINQVRELKEADNRWDVDILRARLETTPSAMPAIDRSTGVSKSLAALQDSLSRTPSQALSTALPELSKALVQKAALIKTFRTENEATKAALQAVIKSVGDLAAESEHATSSKPQQPSLTQSTQALRAAASHFYSEESDTATAELNSAYNDLHVSASLSDHAAALGDNVKALLTHGALEQQLFKKLSFLTPGPRLDALAFSYGREVEATLQDKERFRVYLVAYAVALLVLLGYLGAKLRAANVDLELKVQERTRELSAALTNLKESETQLIQSEKMSSLGQMVAGVAHEINTPLAYVKNSLGAVAEKLPLIAGAVTHSEKLTGLLLAGDKADPTELNHEFSTSVTQLKQLRDQHVLKELMGLVKDGLYGTGQMAEIVSNLKDFSRLDRSKVTSYQLNQGLDSTLLLAKHALKSVVVTKQYGEIPQIVCSPSQLNQVFLNLITNAAQAMEGMPGGTIMLTTSAAEGGVTVKVADNGKGIPPDVLPKIFDPFFTTKAIGKGTGLGLSISYKIVQQHGGRINVQSHLGTGTEFIIWLPLKPPVEARLDG